jgi:hypothetical protein
VVPAACSGLIVAGPLVLTLISLPVDGSNAKLSGAMTFACPVDGSCWVVQVELSTSATKASFTPPPTNSGNSSLRKRKSTDRQFAFAGTLKPTRRTVTSMSL